jgi:hypothetical protein
LFLTRKDAKAQSLIFVYFSQRRRDAKVKDVDCFYLAETLRRKALYLFLYRKDAETLRFEVSFSRKDANAQSFIFVFISQRRRDAKVKDVDCLISSRDAKTLRFKILD